MKTHVLAKKQEKTRKYTEQAYKVKQQAKKETNKQSKPKTTDQTKARQNKMNASKTARPRSQSKTDKAKQDREAKEGTYKQIHETNKTNKHANRRASKQTSNCETNTDRQAAAPENINNNIYNCQYGHRQNATEKHQNN